jgi:ribonuclease Z
MHFVFLGTSGAIPSLSRDTTSLAFVGDDAVILVDCGGSPLQKLLAAGVNPSRLTHVIITHTHPDHAYGLPSLIQNLLLLKRSAPLDLYCRTEHAATLDALLGLFGLWKRLTFRLELHGVEPREGEELLRTPSFVVTASPNSHGAMPNLALRVDVPSKKTAIVYSSDTEPCEAVVRLARGAHTLIHEATFPERDRGRHGVHSTAAEAGRVAAKAGVECLILTHIDALYHGELDGLAAEARRHFTGQVEIAEELRPYPISR